ncbi:hypothetical protein [Pelosinus sp. sgz500959]|uniref:hypothetical protein n=1 Tax=Pelosinus sp. sgz500959 TaxID=3242472 RepID=UPI00366D279E
MTLRRYTAAVVLSTALAFISPAGVDAASFTTSTLTASVGNVSISSSETRLSGDNIRFAQVLSSSYNRTVSPTELIRLRADFDFGLGDISLIYATAVYSGRSVDEISHYRHENMGWGEIAKLYGVKVKDLKKGNDDVVNAARERGIDVTYIEIDDHDERDRDDKNDHKKDNKREDKYQKEKDHGHKK